MEYFPKQKHLPKIAEVALNGLQFVAERLKGGAWAELANTCQPEHFAEVVQLNFDFPPDKAA